MQEFRVFFRDGTHTDVEGETYGRDNADWVVYRGSDITKAEESARFSSAEVNGVALRCAAWKP